MPADTLTTSPFLAITMKSIGSNTTSIRKRMSLIHQYLFLSSKTFTQHLRNLQKTPEMRLLCRFFLLAIILFSPFYAESDTVDSLLYELSLAKTDTLKHNILYKLGKVYYNKDYDKSLDYVKQSLAVIEKSNRKDLAAASYHSMGAIYMVQGEFDLAIENLNNALLIFKKIGDHKNQAGVLNDIGLIFKNKGKYDLATEKFITALKIYESLHDVEGISIVSNNIGQVQYFKGDFESAIECFSQYYEVNRIIKNPYAVAGGANNIASAYLELANFSKAIEYFFIALRVYDSLNVKVGKGIIQDNLGSLFYDIEQLDDALKYHKDALEIFEELKSPLRISPTKLNIAKVYLKRGQIDAAITELTQALEIIEPFGKIVQQRDIYKLLSDAHEQKRNYEPAFNFLKKYQSINDSIINVETLENIEKIKTEYETEKRSKEIESTRKTLSIQRILLIVTIGSLLIICLLGIFNHHRSINRQEELRRLNSFKNECIRKFPFYLNTSPTQLVASKQNTFSEHWSLLPDNTRLPKIYFRSIVHDDFAFAFILILKKHEASIELISVAIEDFIGRQRNTFVAEAFNEKLLNHIYNYPLTQGFGSDYFSVMPFIISNGKISSFTDSHLIIYQDKKIKTPKSGTSINLNPNDFVYIHTTVGYDETSENQKDFLKLFNTIVHYDFERQPDIARNTLRTIDMENSSLIFAFKV